MQPNVLEGFSKPEVSQTHVWREGGVDPTGKQGKRARRHLKTNKRIFKTSTKPKSRNPIKRQKTMFGTKEHGPTWKGSYGNEAMTPLSVIFPQPIAMFLIEALAAMVTLSQTVAARPSIWSKYRSQRLRLFMGPVHRGKDAFISLFLLQRLTK